MRKSYIIGNCCNLSLWDFCGSFLVAFLKMQPKKRDADAQYPIKINSLLYRLTKGCAKIPILRQPFVLFYREDSLSAIVCGQCFLEQIGHRNLPRVGL